MHKFGDVVLYQMGVPEKTVNALVVQSNPQPDGEHLIVVFLDPVVASSSMSGMLVDKAIARAFPAPLKEGVAYGWKDLPTSGSMAPDTVYLDPLRYQALLGSEKTLDGLFEPLTELSMTVAKIAPHMEISPDGTLISAKTLLESMSTQVPAPIQPKNPAMMADIEEAKKAAVAADPTSGEPKPSTAPASSSLSASQSSQPLMSDSTNAANSSTTTSNEVVPLPESQPTGSENVSESNESAHSE